MQSSGSQPPESGPNPSARTMWRLLRALGPYRGQAAGALISLVLMTATVLGSPQVIRWVVDNLADALQGGTAGIADFDWRVVRDGTLLLSGLAVGRGVFNFLQNFLGEKASQSVAFDLRNQIYTKVHNLSFSYHDRAQTGQLMTRATNDVELVRQFMGQGLFLMITSSLMLAGTFAVLIYMNWRLAIVTGVIFPLNILLLVVFVRVIRPYFGNIQATLDKLNARLQENLSGIRVVKAFARADFEIDRFAVENENYRLNLLKFINSVSKVFPATFLMSNIQLTLILGFGGNLVMQDALSIGDLTAFITYLIFLTMPLMTIGFLAGMMVRALVSAERIFEVLDTPSELTDAPNARVLGSVAGRVQFRDVYFRYAGQSTDVLKGVSFLASPGQTIAIMGKTGSGKSSIINLLPRFYDVSSGSVTIDGEDVRAVTLASLRSQIGIVLQEAILFSGTIASNIAYGRPEASQAEIEQAARAAAAHDFIVELPDGYESRVGERGVGLSGGQRQRVAIARALLMDPRILILDDSTSAVDAETEERILEALRLLMQDRTSFVIAQRISTVREADQVLVLEGGHIVDRGTHEELVAHSSIYADIIASQFNRDAAREQAVLRRQSSPTHVLQERVP
ncbi:MAG: ABC transporter ATP-binding protein [Caldilineaceae bacterium]|nr:ABC transporter ATP-binding protein [Caldilineaceae bacterium]